MIDQKKHNHAFTLTELMVSVIIVGIVAGFGIPCYTKAVNRAKEKDAVFNLRIIRETVRSYIAREGNNPPDLATVSAINTTLNLYIIEQEGNTYNCGSGGTPIYICTATNTAPWSVQFDPTQNNGEIFCSAGPCPSCDASDCPY